MSGRQREEPLVARQPEFHAATGKVRATHYQSNFVDTASSLPKVDLVYISKVDDLGSPQVALFDAIWKLGDAGTNTVIRTPGC